MLSGNLHSITSREYLGELIQIDSSDHRWLEDRGAPCTLLVFIDDATSRTSHLALISALFEEQMT
jgi:hypothetical protein